MATKQTNNAPLQVEDLYKKFREGLEHFLIASTRDPELAADLEQETFIRIMVYLRKGGSIHNPKSYLYTTALNVMRDHFRKQKVRPSVSGIDESVDYEGEQHDNPESDMCDDYLLWECVHLMVNDLPEPYNNAVKMADLNRVPQKQLARKAGISESGMKSRVQRGRTMLRERFLEIITRGPGNCPYCDTPIR